jgi:hypothetical protein
MLPPIWGESLIWDRKIWSWDSWDSHRSWRMMYSGMLRPVALVRTDISEELSASFIRVTRIGELGTMLAVTSNRRTLRRNTKCALSSPKRRFIQEPRGVTSQKTPFFIVTAVKTSNLTTTEVDFQLSSLWVTRCYGWGTGTVRQPTVKGMPAVGNRYQENGEDSADRDDPVRAVEKYRVWMNWR